MNSSALGHVRFTPNSDHESGFPEKSCPLYPRKQTFAAQWRMSAKGQKRTLAAYSIIPSAICCRRSDHPSACSGESRCVPLAKASPRNLCAPGAPEGLCCLSGGHESGVSILRRHRRGRLDISQAASCGSGEYRRGGGLIIRELGNR